MKKKSFYKLFLFTFVIITCVNVLSACKKVEFKIDFIVDGSVYATVKTNGEEVVKMPTDPQKEGYEFEGWYNGSTKVTKIEKGSSGYLKLEAKWKPIEYEITYLNTNEVENSNKTSYTIETATFNLADLSREGYKFEGWYNGSTKVTKIEKGSSGYLKLEAKWKPIEYIATFKADGQIVGTATYTIEDETIKNVPNVPTKNGYDGEWEKYSLKVGGITINAVYTIKQYSITYLNTKGVENSNKASYTIETATFNLADLSREGYKFEGWYNGSTKVTKIEKGSYGNLELEAKWKPIEYIATFKANGQIIGTTTYTIEDETIKNVPNVPTKNGYDGEWEKYSLKVGGITINAVYSAKQYTITWKNDDGTTLKTTKCEHGSIPSFGDTIPTKKRDSQYKYTFNMWSPEIVVATENVIYVAIYSKTLCTTYKITYDANGGTNAPVSQNKTKGNSIILSSIVPTNEDHIFIGWSCANDEKIYNAGSTFNIDANVTLYAVWGHECDTCNGNGTITTKNTCSSCNGKGKITTTSEKWSTCFGCNGKGSTSITYSSTCSSCMGFGGPVLCKCSCGNTWWANQTGNRKCSKCGKVVSGIRYGTCSTCSGSGLVKKTSTTKCTSCNGTGGAYVPVSSTKTCSTCSGVGTISKTTTCTTCNGNKNIIDENDSHKLQLKDGNKTIETVIVVTNSPYKLKVPVRIGYTFLGWFDSINGGIQYTDAEGISLSVWKGTNSKSLYARWSLNYYTITYECDELVNIAGLPVVYTVVDSQIHLNVQNRTFYNFNWILDGTAITFIDTKLAKNIVVKGVWSPVEYTIEYEYNGGNATNRRSYNIETADFTLNNPSRVGYTFIGWTGSNGNVPQTNVTIDMGTSGDLSYTANWKLNQYTISFNTNGGSHVDSITQVYGSIITAPNKPILNGRSFVGWFTDSSLTKEYNFTTMPAENITLYAKWIEYSVSISCDETTEISINDDVTSPDTYNATAIDTDGNSVNVVINVVGGTFVAGKTITVRLVATGLNNAYATKTISNIKVYGTPSLTYDTTKDYFNLSDTLNDTLWAASVVDTFGNALNVNVSVKETTYKAGDLVTIVISTTDIAGNETKVEIENVKVYGNPTITRDTSKNDMKVTDIISNELFGVSAVDSFGVELDVTTIKYNGTLSGGNTITIKSSVTDSKGNTNYIMYSIKVYGTPSISSASTTSFKVSDDITLDTLGITAKDSFGNTLTNVTIKLTSGTQIAGATLTYLVTATDHLGNVNTREITGIKIYGTPTISYDTEKDAMKVTDTIDSSLFSAIAKDSFNDSLSVNVELNNGTFAGGNIVTFKLSTIDALGNEYSVVTKDIKVYSSDDINLTYNVAGATSIKKSSIGEEFNATAVNSFGETCVTSIEAASGYTLAGGNIINLYIAATDALGNTTKSELISNIKVYDIPTLVYTRDYPYIQNGDSPYALFQVLDSFGNELLFNVETVSGSLDVNETITYRITATDKVKNNISVEYTLVVLDTEESILELYRDGVKVGTQRVYKGSSYTLPKANALDAVWYLDKTILTDENGVSLVEWDQESGGYILTNAYYTITYNANGGEVNIESQRVYFGVSYTLPVPTREGWTFIGWYNDSTLYQASIWNTKSDIVLTANWISKPFIENGNQYIYFGEYPQTLKGESVTITSTTPDSNGYYLGSDNERYAKVNAKPYLPYSSSIVYFNNKQKIVKGTTYYFKVEPIKWKILQVNGTEYKLVTDLIIDNQKFHSSTDTRTIDGKTIYANNYEHSDIRKWLNEDFYNKAFTKVLQSYINTTLVDNSLASTGDSSNKYICNDTYDKVYLLSYKDITNEEYGFTNNKSRQKQLTDYAKALGCYMVTSTDYYNNGLYWLRSPKYYNDINARYVYSDGNVDCYWVDYDFVGVSAAITISLS